jgi:hypothetical protein
MTEPFAVSDVDSHVTEPADLWTTSLSPGPGSIAGDAKTTIANNLATLPDTARRKVLHDTAARIYKLDV